MGKTVKREERDDINITNRDEQARAAEALSKTHEETVLVKDDFWTVKGAKEIQREWRAPPI